MRQLFRAFIPASVIGLAISEAILIFFCYIAGEWLVIHLLNPYIDMTYYLVDDGGIIQISIVVACLILGLYFQNLYSNVRVKSATLLLQQVCLLVGLAFLIQAFLAYARHPEWSLPRWTMILGSILAIAVIPGWRLFFSRAILKYMGTQKILFLGTSAVSREIAAHLTSRPEIGMSVVGYIDDHVDLADLPGGSVIGPIKDLSTIAGNLRPDVIVVGMTERRRELPMPEMLHLRFSGIHFEEAAVTFEAAFGRVSTREMRPSRLVYSSELGPRKGSLFWHSLYSLPISIVLLILFSPVMLITAIIVKLTSPGPIFHRQLRVGLNGAVFTVYKFRSMYIDAEARTGPVWAKKDDPRITRPGKFIRRFRIDEFPQLLNVLRGDMALVGPRPERPEFVKSLNEHIPYFNYRHCVKPGITGWAQINYKYGDTLEDAIMKLEYDLYYIKNMSPTLDAYIIFHTAKAMLLTRGAQ